MQDDAADNDDDVPEELEEVVEQLLCGLRDRYVCSTVGIDTRWVLLCLAERLMQNSSGFAEIGLCIALCLTLALARCTM
jgi:hypothetical protein